ncbi:Sec-independent protein translocase TatB [Microbacterium profundi]|uniref:Sec-independent protein translocase TatB n=1 Tax=Microbacterium profundi TaxID=450380 RepID=A0ABV3LHB7_9MICO|nr:translocase [Microbacterium profundi]MCE7482805.1 Sec-independent protein translocase TatB [Microbacterium profundi]
MDFGLTFEKLLLIGVIAAVIIGPERLPKAAETFAGFVRRAGEYLRDTKSKMRDEIGPEIDDVDWRKLDPRQYDPRRIIRDALMDDAPSGAAATASAAAGTASAAAGTAAVAASAATPLLDPPRSPMVRPAFTSEAPPPFDLEAT